MKKYLIFPGLSNGIGANGPYIVVGQLMTYF